MQSKTKGDYNGVGRRVISIVLAIALICSFGLTSVFAEGGARTTNSGVKYTVTVTNGTASLQTVAEGETVTITANPAPAGYVFDKWTTTSGVAFENESIIETTFTMPASDVTVVATYKVDKTDLEGFIFGIYEILFDENGYLMIEISEDGTEVPKNKEWVTQEEYYTFELVFLAAMDVLNALDATPETVAKAIDDLSLATNEFSAAMKPGSLEESSIVVTVLAEKETIAIDEATTLTAVVEGDGGAGYILTWLSDKDDVVRLELEEDLKISVTGVGRGTSKIDVSLDEGVTVADSVTITVMASLENLGEDIAGIEGYFFDDNDLIIKPSEDGENISKDDMWAPSEACEAFIEAFNAAVKVYDEQLAAGENVDVDIVDEAYGVFETACFEFGELVKVGKAELADAITAAKTTKTNVVIGTDAANVDVGIKWVTEAEMTALTTAIIAAEAAKDTVRYEADVTAAATAMATATTTFNTAKKDGTKPVTVDKTALTDAITAANAAKTDVVINTDAANVDVGTKWVTAEDMTALDAAISTAEAAKDTVRYEADVTAAATAMTTATTTFNTAKKDGAKLVTLDKKALTDAITAANAAKTGVVINTAAANVDVGTKWVTEAEMTALTAAISTATAAIDTVKNSADVTAAATAMATATTTFEGKCKDGTKPVTVDKTKLADALDATEKVLDVVIGTDQSASAVTKGQKFVTIAELRAFTPIVNTAGAAFKTVKTTAEADAAAKVLTDALKAFEKLIKTGTYTSGGNGGGGTSSGGGSSTGTPSVDAPSSNVGSAGEVKSEDIKQETAKSVSEALKANKNATANVTVKNAETISPAALKDMAAAAKAAGGKAQLMADSVVNGAIEARLYIDPTLATTLKESIKLGVKTNSLGIDATKEKFGKYFANEIAIASFEQQGSFGIEIQAAVKLDLTKLDTKKLVFYSYDKATNTYVPIVAKYTIDKNGYVHFTTAVGGDIIITDKALTKKK